VAYSNVLLFPHPILGGKNYVGIFDGRGQHAMHADDKFHPLHGFYLKA